MFVPSASASQASHVAEPGRPAPPDRLSRSSTPERIAPRALPAAALRSPAVDWAPPPGCPMCNLRVRQHEYRATYWLFAALVRPPAVDEEGAQNVQNASSMLRSSARRMLEHWRAETTGVGLNGGPYLTRAMLAPSQEVAFTSAWPDGPRHLCKLNAPPRLDLGDIHSDAELGANWWQITRAISALRLCIRQGRAEALPEDTASLAPAEVACRLNMAVAQLHDDPDAGCPMGSRKRQRLA